MKFQLEKENLQLIAELEEQKKEREKADDECTKLLDLLDQVCKFPEHPPVKYLICFKTVQAFATLQEDELVDWTLKNLETSNHDLQ
jgi:hypothetical protein